MSSLMLRFSRSAMIFARSSLSSASCRCHVSGGRCPPGVRGGSCLSFVTYLSLRHSGRFLGRGQMSESPAVFERGRLYAMSSTVRGTERPTSRFIANPLARRGSIRHRRNRRGGRPVHRRRFLGRQRRPSLLRRRSGRRHGMSWRQTSLSVSTAHGSPPFCDCGAALRRTNEPFSGKRRWVGEQ